MTQAVSRPNFLNTCYNNTVAPCVEYTKNHPKTVACSALGLVGGYFIAAPLVASYAAASAVAAYATSLTAATCAATTAAPLAIGHLAGGKKEETTAPAAIAAPATTEVVASAPAVVASAAPEVTAPVAKIPAAPKLVIAQAPAKATPFYKVNLKTDAAWKSLLKCLLVVPILITALSYIYSKVFAKKAEKEIAQPQLQQSF